MEQKILQSLKKSLLILVFALFNLPIFFLIALISNLWRMIKSDKEYSVFWGTEPIINSHHWARATQQIFTRSEFISRYDSRILNGRASSVLFSSKQISNPVLRLVRSFSENLVFFKTFSKVLISANLVCISCDGFIFQHYKILGFNYKVELFILRLARIKICVLPYGADAYIYSKIQDKNWLYGLMCDYPGASKSQTSIENRVNFYVKNSDIFLPGAMLFDGLGRSDWITPSTLCIEVPEQNYKRKTPGNTFIVTHAPNHRTVKGTRHIISAIEELVARGMNIKLKLLEHKSNEEVLRVLSEESDLHIDQLFFDGYGLNALESMSLGVPTVGNFSGPQRDFFDRWSFTQDCPMVIANEISLVDVLSRLIDDKDALEEISKKSQNYVNKYHSSKVFAENFIEILKKTDPVFVLFLKSNN
jgi:hypothetical protein